MLHEQRRLVQNNKRERDLTGPCGRTTATQASVARQGMGVGLRYP
ncbi:hypothetical protein GGD70_005202 [Paraburkholderia fungorum]|nr:hypothetical protein [Paraburkholderia fungorum]